MKAQVFCFSQIAHDSYDSYSIDDFTHIVEGLAIPSIFIIDEADISTRRLLFVENGPQPVFWVFTHCTTWKNFGRFEERIISKHDVMTDPRSIEKAVNHAESALEYWLRYQDLAQKSHADTEKLKQLNQVGTALMMERNLGKLLDLILLHCRTITHADAGSVYIVEETEDGKVLRFKHSQNDSLKLSYEEFTMPYNKKSMAGYVAISQETVAIADVYNLPEDCEYGFNKSFDQNNGYRSKSMLTLPMVDHQNTVVGVIQLINRKIAKGLILKKMEEFEENVIPFNDEDIELVRSLAGQAAVAIENNLLYRSIENLFEGFVKASVKAIESRDPTTKGHSERVSRMTVQLAENLNRVETGCLASYHFSDKRLREIRYAGLLHDFGKVGVREHVLMKAKKLYPKQFELVKMRLELAKNLRKNEALKQLLCQPNGQSMQQMCSFIEQKLLQEENQFNHFWELIDKANMPSVLEQETAGELDKLAAFSQKFNDYFHFELLADDELELLSIPRGTLSQEERLEIESHVQHTYRFLSIIPWTKDLSDVCEIAYCHHEKLNGMGYPRKLDQKNIPIESQMMAIVDIFDALSAWDRPYKKALPLERSLSILEGEAQRGAINADLLQVFIESKVYDILFQWKDEQSQ